jgi:hypothetical protein
VRAYGLEGYREEVMPLDFVRQSHCWRVVGPAAEERERRKDGATA